MRQRGQEAPRGVPHPCFCTSFMSAELLARWPSRTGLLRLESRSTRLLLLLVGVVCYVAGVVFHVAAFASGKAPGLGFVLGYNVFVLVCFSILWMLMSRWVKERRSTPARTFWTLLFVGVLLALAELGLAQIGHLAIPGPASAGFDYETGVPLALATVVKMNVLSLLEVTFAFYLLLRLRDLVLYKRSKASVRNWHLMLGFIAFAALCMFMKSPQADAHWLEALVMVPAILLMVVNSFRLSWIVNLTFREKMAVIGLSLLLLVLLAVEMNLAVGESVMYPGTPSYLAYYSPPLALFTTLAFVFGILYCTTAFLSLLFHLPTTGDFQRKADELAAMHSLTKLVSQLHDRERLVATITASPVEAGAADAAWLTLADPQSGSLRPRLIAANGIDPARVEEAIEVTAFHDDVVGTHEPVLLDQASVDHRVALRPGEGLGSLLVIPLIARDDVLGALFIAREVTHGFEKDDVEALRVFAAQAALALDNARLFEEQIEKERLARELAIAREVQQKLLPQNLPVLDGLTMAASSVSAQEVGGDYYDLSLLDEHRIAFIVADVSGKGTSAAFYMAEMQGIFKAVTQIAPDPKDFLQYANRALTGSLEKSAFISVLYGVLDLEREELVMARAGHCPAATINLHGEARYVRTQGLGLGLDAGPLFAKTLGVERLRLQPGDVFVLYTDGVVESRRDDGEEYGYDRLINALREYRHEDATAIHNALMADLDGFIGQCTYTDDLTLLILKWHGTGMTGLAAPSHRRETIQENSATRTALLE